MVKSFPLDYMHFICLGVVKRLIGIWVDGSKKDLPNKLDSGPLDEVNQMIKACSKFFHWIESKQSSVFTVLGISFLLLLVIAKQR